MSSEQHGEIIASGGAVDLLAKRSPQAAALVIAVATALPACGPRGGEPPPGPTARPPPSAGSPRVHRFTNNWGRGLGCVPRGPELALTGTLVVRPFGKGTDGAVLQTDAGDWVVSYRAEGALLALRDRRVVARGRACDKQGEAVSGQHLDLATLAEDDTAPPAPAP